MTLSFAGKSEYLLSVSRGSKPQLSVWNMSKLSLSWSYRLHIEGLEILFSFMLRADSYYGSLYNFKTIVDLNIIRL